ncbi:hypothetical protein HN958_04510 [Candidatus Falkowbacteria bacterium]|nr:hypothetical protein [Candidatus Falkowbacteria bacterium]
MRLSRLQKFILKTCYNSKVATVDRVRFLEFYRGKKSPKQELRAKIITGSIESLIDKELMTGYGVRTPHKWFIKKVGLTGKGKKEVKRLMGEQLELKLK